MVWVQPGAEEDTLEPLTAGRGVRLGGGGGLLIVEEEGLPELGLTFVCLAKNRRGEAEPKGFSQMGAELQCYHHRRS